MKFVIKSVIVALVLSLAMGVTLITVSAEAPEATMSPLAVEGEVSPFGIYVGGIAVTEENRNDIFAGSSIASDSDTGNTAPHAAYYEEDGEGQLRLSGNINLTTYTVMDGVRYAILSTNTLKKIRVIIGERSDVTLSAGVRVERGSFEVWELSTLTFEGDSSSASAAFAEVKHGDMSMDNCHVECTSTDMVSVVDATVTKGVIPAGVGFSADNITIKSSDLRITSTAREVPLHAVLWAKEDVNIEEMASVHIEGTNRLYVADAFVRAGVILKINDANLDVNGVGCLFDLPKAKLSIKGRNYIYSSSVWGMILGRESKIEGDTNIDMVTGEGGIAVVGTQASFRVGNDTKFYIKHSSVATSGTSRTNSWDNRVSAALYFEKCRVHMKDTNFTALGHTFGIVSVTGGEKNTFTGEYNIAADVAFFAAAQNKGDISFGSTLKGDAVLVSIPARNTLGGLGNYAIALVPTGGAGLAATGTPMTSVADIPAAFSGYARDCNVSAEAFPLAAVIVPCAFVLVALVAIILFYKTGHLFGWRHHENDKNEDAPAVSTADTPIHEDHISPTEEPTDAND